jgi:hypothetical protein
MPELVLSTGKAIRTEDIDRAEYYATNSLNSYGCHFGGPEMRQCPFLFLQLKETTERVSGEQADADAIALERFGVRIIRHSG